MNRTNGRIAEKSKFQMTEALLGIMEIYDYKDITVTQIVQEAGLSRNTFYRLFKDKDEILKCMLNKLFDEFYDRVKTESIESFWNVMQVYFDFWEEHKALLILLNKNNLLMRVLDISYRRSDEVFRFVHAKDKINNNELPLDYLLAFSVGGMHNMLLKWVSSGMDVPSEELIGKLRSCLMYNAVI